MRKCISQNNTSVLLSKFNNQLLKCAQTEKAVAACNIKHAQYKLNNMWPCMETIMHYANIRTYGWQNPKLFMWSVWTMIRLRGFRSTCKCFSFARRTYHFVGFVVPFLIYSWNGWRAISKWSGLPKAIPMSQSWYQTGKVLKWRDST